jgi:monomeric isocitrate dehydrogenase
MLLSDRILQHQYRTKNYQTYSVLIYDLLQAEKHDELTLRNHHQRSVGSAPLPEVHYNVKGNEKCDGVRTFPRNNPQVVGEIRAENTHTTHVNTMEPISFWCSKLGYVFWLYSSVYIDILHEK